MLGYVTRRVLVMIPTLIVISALVFIIIQLPPGDYFTTYMNELQSQGEGSIRRSWNSSSSSTVSTSR